VTTPRRLVALVGLGLLYACGGQPRGAVGPVPTSPEATVDQFLAAVNANDLQRMAQLFGDERGPSSAYMKNVARRDSIMTILQTLLVTDSAHHLGSEPVPGHRSWRVLRMDLFRGTKQTAVPFTVLPRHGGWLVQEIDIRSLMPGASTGAAP
jgi:hypothetical protein